VEGVGVTEANSGSTTHRTDLIGTSNTALVVTGLMLPVGGAVARFVTLASAGLADTFHLAVAVSPAELAASGSMPVLLLGMSLALARYVASPAIVRALKASRLPLRRDRVAVAEDLVLLLIATVGFGGWIVGLVSSAGVGYSITTVTAAGLSVWISVSNRLSDDPPSTWLRPIRGIGLAVALVVLYGLAAISYGFGGRLGAAALVTFADPAVFPSGPYIRVAEDTDWLYLAPCAAHGTVVGVPKSLVRTIAWSHPEPGVSENSQDPYRNCPRAK
jgi:hypothetical protein